MTKEPRFYNRIVDKGQLKKLVSWAYSKYGSARTAQMADMLKELGFRYATRAGVSISVDDLQVPPVKRQMLAAAEGEIRRTEERYTRGEITEVERFQKVIDTWNSTSEALKDEVVRNFKETDPLNSVYMMAFSGARGNLSQVRQLVGMRGLMADPQGEIIDLPIKTNFREGLTVTEYIISSYGARKGLVDTALRTADSGYLTRRLVDVSQDVIVREVDCGTTRAVSVAAMTDGDRVLIPLADKLFGRVLGEDVIHPRNGKLILGRSQQLTEPVIKEIVDAEVKEVMVRSPLTCEAARSVCQMCYGWSLAHGHPVDLGEAVGIIAAQSIGEPGTQLTMRTFHTGGVFTGEVARQVRAQMDGIVNLKGLRTRPVRTRHGEDREQVEVAGELILTPVAEAESSGLGAEAAPLTPTTPPNKVTATSFPITAGSLMWVESGEQVVKGQMLAEVAIAKARRSTEKAVKDVASGLAGEVHFADLVPEEKTDRQGNTTRTAVRGGLIWVLSGEVYNLPPSAEPVVKNGDKVELGSVLAQTKLVSANGGVVRLRSEREIDIITASVVLNKAQVLVTSTGGREHYVINTTDNQRFGLLAAPGTKVQNHAPVAELIDDRYRTSTGGIIKYAGVEVQKKGKAKLGYEVISGGTLLWIPEETHEVNKDIGLLNVEDGQYVEAATEVVKDIFCKTTGIVEVVQKNDILREIIIKPGDLHLIDDPDLQPSTEGTLVYPGEQIMPGLPTNDRLRYVEYVETPEGPALLVRPVTEFTVPDSPNVPAQASINQQFKRIELRAVQRLPYKDSERVKSVEGVDLLRTQLVLEMDTSAISSQLAADIELVTEQGANGSEILRLQLVILESLVVRRDTAADPLGGSTNTSLLVKDGEQIAPGAVVARTEIHCKETGVVRGIREGAEAIRRLLVVRDADRISIDTNGQKPTVKRGQLLVAGSAVAPGVPAPESGQVVEVVHSKDNSQHSIALRIARPYRVSPGAILHIENGDLVQRGDNLVLLVFERSKTGDIIQGLPRIEELLEARKPKEACILSRRAGTASVVYSEDEATEVKVIEAGGLVTDYPLMPTQNVIVSDGQQVESAEPLTDGPANPHEILEIFFDLYREEQGIYEAALLALQKAQKFLVNEVQSVYQSQGIDIADKHIEVIVRQMTSKVRVDDGGDTTMLPGELVELRQVEQVNEAMAITGLAPAEYTPVLLGITKASLNTDSFISAASFQETTRVLTEAAIEGKSDWLRGLKENVIIGRLIPAGTGFNAYEEPGMTATSSMDEYPVAPSQGVYPFGESPGAVADDSLDVVLDDRTARAFSPGDEPPDFDAEDAELEEIELAKSDLEEGVVGFPLVLDDEEEDDDIDEDEEWDDLDEDEE